MTRNMDNLDRVFDELGHEHPLTMRYRRQLAASLY
jgi:thioredoxin-like negative regulator of GroEL